MAPLAILLLACAPLQIPANGYLRVHEATTCEYRVSWDGWSPPRLYVFHPDAEGWIFDHFIVGDLHGHVYWNVRTNRAMVKPISKPLTTAEARTLAAHAKATIFPAIDLSSLDAMIAR